MRWRQNSSETSDIHPQSESRLEGNSANENSVSGLKSNAMVDSPYLYAKMPLGFEQDNTDHPTEDGKIIHRAQTIPSTLLILCLHIRRCHPLRCSGHLARSLTSSMPFSMRSRNAEFPPQNNRHQNYNSEILSINFQVRAEAFKILRDSSFRRLRIVRLESDTMRLDWSPAP